MTLQSSGAISLNDIHIEAGGSSGTQASINDSDIRGLIGKASGAQSSFSEFYGASAAGSVGLITTNGWTNSGSGTSSSPWTGNSTTSGTANSDANIYFYVSGGSVTLKCDIYVSSEYLYDLGYIYNGGTNIYTGSGTDFDYNTITVADGSYLRIRYTKDGSVDSGDDAVFHTVYVI